MTRDPGQLHRRAMVAAVVGQGLRALITLLGVVVLARLIGPEEYGRFSLLWVVLIFLDNVRSVGWIEAVIQVPEVDGPTLRGLFWRTVVLGGIFGAVMAAAGPLFGLAYGESGLLGPSLGLALFFVLGGLNLIPQALWRRQMRFYELNLANTLCLAVATLLAVLVAWGGGQIWALVTLHVARESLFSLWLLAGKRARDWAWHWGKLPPVFHQFGRDLLVQRLVSVHALRLEQILLPMVAGVAALGIYNRMYTLVEMPTRNLRIAVGEVAHASLSRLQPYPARQAAYFRRLLHALAWLWLPIVAVLWTAGQSVIHVALGDAWLPGLPYLHALALAGTGLLIWYACIWRDTARGATRQSRNWAITQAIVVFSLIGITAPFGATAIVWAYSLGLLGLALARLQLAMGTMRVVEPRLHWSSFTPALIGAAAVGVVFAASGLALAAWSDLERLIAASATCGLLGAGWLVRSPQARVSLRSWRELLWRRGGTA